MIYGAETDRNLPKNPKGFLLNANSKHYRNKKETQKVINEIISPRVKSAREELKLSSNFSALLVMDVFRDDSSSSHSSEGSHLHVTYTIQYDTYLPATGPYGQLRIKSL